MKRHFFGAVGSLTALLLVAGCASDPTASLRGDIASVLISRTYVELDVGESLRLNAKAYDSQGNVVGTLPTVTVDDASIATVTVDAATSGDPLPQTDFELDAVGYGTTRVIATVGSLSDTLDVQTYPAAISLTGPPSSMRSTETATLTVQPVDVNGDPVSGVPADEITVTVDTPDQLTLNQATFLVTAVEEGGGTISAEGPGGSSGTINIAVRPGLPVSAAFESDLFTALAVGDSARLQVVVSDANGNENNFEDELLSIAITSTDPAAVETWTTVVDSITPGGAVHRALYVWARGLAAGTSDISATVTTSEGDLDAGTATAVVLGPVITVAAPSSLPGANVTIDGIGFLAAGFQTDVLVDGAPVANVVSVSNTQIVAQMPTLLAGTYDLEVSVGGVLSNTDQWTQTADFDEAATEPNNAIGQEAPISASFEFSGTVDGTDVVDLFKFTVSDADRVIEVDLSWAADADLDLMIYPIGAAAPGSETEDLCDFDAATGANPEVATCTLGDPGEYTLEIYLYAGDPASYTVKGTVKP